MSFIKFRIALKKNGKLLIIIWVKIYHISMVTRLIMFENSKKDLEFNYKSHKIDS